MLGRQDHDDEPEFEHEEGEFYTMQTVDQGPVIYLYPILDPSRETRRRLTLRLTLLRPLSPFAFLVRGL